MPQSLSKIYIHLIFSTKNRESWITQDIEKELFAYLSGVCKELGSSGSVIGGVEDHVHLLFNLPKVLTISKMVQTLKTASSAWMKKKKKNLAIFSWQKGYAAFSVDQPTLDAVKNYILNQREHHKTKDFKKELLQLLERHQLDYDERFLWE